jgi:diadenosine tetraphosphate (Ap4A) HIT family hydrolase
MREGKMKAETTLYQDDKVTLRREPYCWSLAIVGWATKYYTDLKELRAAVVGRVWPISWKTAERVAAKIDEMLTGRREIQ